MRLIIIAVVATMSIIPAAQALEGLRNREFVQRAELQLETIISTAQVLAIEGPGGVRTIAVDLGSKCAFRLSVLCIGDGDGGPNMSSVVLELSNGARIVRSAADPSIWLRGIDGEAVRMTSEAFKLRLSCVLSPETVFVLVEVV